MLYVHIYICSMTVYDVPANSIHIYICTRVALRSWVFRSSKESPCQTVKPRHLQPRFCCCLPSSRLAKHAVAVMALKQAFFRFFSRSVFADVERTEAMCRETLQPWVRPGRACMNSRRGWEELQSQVQGVVTWLNVEINQFLSSWLMVSTNVKKSRRSNCSSVSCSFIACLRD